MQRTVERDSITLKNAINQNIAETYTSLGKDESFFAGKVAKLCHTEDLVSMFC